MLHIEFLLRIFSFVLRFIVTYFTHTYTKQKQKRGGELQVERIIKKGKKQRKLPEK